MASFAILLLSLAPTISHALLGEGSQAWTEVCTAQGARWVDSAADSTGEAPGPRTAAAHVFDHCPYCSLHAADLVMPPMAVVVSMLPLRFEIPRLFLAAPRTLHAWLAAQPRAPPPLS